MCNKGTVLLISQESAITSFYFCKQKTAYEMRISDWSSDVCSSDLAGRLSPFALVQEIRAWFDGPLALSGAIANGGAILPAQAMGADLAYIGSPFIATTEANPIDGYKPAIVDGTTSHIVYTYPFPGVPRNYLRHSHPPAGPTP